MSKESATINAFSAAASLAAAGSLGVGVAISGAGAEATNIISGKDNAFVSDSNLTSASTIALSATDQSQITAQIIAASVSLGIGVVGGGVGASIGAAVAQNFIGYDADGNPSPLQVKAYVHDSGISAKGAYTVTANSDQTINALVAALSAAIAGGIGAGVAVAGSGAYAENEIAVDPQAYQDNDFVSPGTNAGISAASVAFSASDTSSINANVGAVSLATSFSVGLSVSVSIGLSLATNTIDNDVKAYLANATTVTTTSGGISVMSEENATIHATSTAASFTVSGGIAGLAISGAGAEATNVINGTDNASVSGSSLTSAAGVSVTTTDTSSIQAIITTGAASVSIGAFGAGASVGAAVAENFVGYNSDGSQPAGGLRPDQSFDHQPGNRQQGQSHPRPLHQRRGGGL